MFRRYSKQVKVFTTRGEPITKVEEFTSNMQLVISERGQSFVPIAVNIPSRNKFFRYLMWFAVEKDRCGEARGKNEEGTRGNREKVGTVERRYSYACKACSSKGTKNLYSYYSNILQHLSKLPLGITEIIEGFLYLGSARDAHTEEELKKFNILQNEPIAINIWCYLYITHILNVAADIPPSRVAGIVSKHIKMWDEISEKLDMYRNPTLLKFISLMREYISIMLSSLFRALSLLVPPKRNLKRSKDLYQRKEEC